MPSFCCVYSSLTRCWGNPGMTKSTPCPQGISPVMTLQGKPHHEVYLWEKWPRECHSPAVQNIAWPHLSGGKPWKKPHWFRASEKGFVSILMHTRVYPRVNSDPQVSSLNVWIRNHKRSLFKNFLNKILVGQNVSPRFLLLAGIVSTLKVI